MSTQIKNFGQAYGWLCDEIKEAPVVHTARWQGLNIANNPMMECKELTHVHLDIPLPVDFLEHYAWDTGAEMPWAHNHFLERVSGYPMNPGSQWAEWSQNKRYGDGAKSFLDERGKFNHNYMERYWPRFAGQVEAPTQSAQDWRQRFTDQNRGGPGPVPNKGIMYEYGQLNDVVDLLAEDPYTRQAILPIFFPEDTGGGSKRAPCTISYNFLMRNDQFDVFYHIRSCDLFKHFRNDLYLTIALHLWVLDKLRRRDPFWRQVRPGRFIMQITSLHLFKPDWELIP